MRIEAYQQIANLYQTQKTVKTEKTTSAYVTDQLSISQAGRDYQIAKQAVSQASDVREDLVADLKAKVKAGTYEVSADDFASKLLQKYNELI